MEKSKSIKLTLWFTFLGLFSLSVFQNASIAIVFENELEAPTSRHRLLNEQQPLVVELGIEYRHPSFPEISGVRVENEQTSNTTRSGTVDMNYPAVFAQTLKIQGYLNEQRTWTAFFKTWLPLSSLSEFDTGNIYQPEYALYRSEFQRPRILLASSLDLSPEWRVGAALDLGFSVSGQANLYLQTGTTSSGAPKYSDQRISTKIKPALVPQASVLFRPEATQQEYSFVVRAENKARMTLDVTSAADVFGNNAAVRFGYITTSALYYQPWDFELGASHQVSEALKLKGTLSYQLWTGYEARAAVIGDDVSNQCNGNGGCSNSFSATQAPSVPTRNLWVPAVGLEWQLADYRLGLRYQFKDSIFKGLPNNTNTNYLDPPRHDLQMGVVLPNSMGWEWSIHAQGSLLVSQTVTKNQVDDIGWPGYTAGGWVYGGGVSVAIPFRN